MTSETTVVTLPSGAKLEVWLVELDLALRLQEAIAEEAKRLKINALADILDPALFKDLAAHAIASREIRGVIGECLKKCTYNGVKISPETFEPPKAREDFWLAHYHCAQVNLRPFTKSLAARWKPAVGLFFQSVAAEVLKRPELVQIILQAPPVQEFLKDLASKSATTPGPSGIAS